MQIELKLSKDFERCLEDLKKKYGEDFEYINGVHPSQLDFSEFIDNFVEKDTLADASIDPNANANHKDIRSFMTEKGKSEDKLFGLNKIFLSTSRITGTLTTAIFGHGVQKIGKTSGSIFLRMLSDCKGC